MPTALIIVGAILLTYVLLRFLRFFTYFIFAGLAWACGAYTNDGWDQDMSYLRIYAVKTLCFLMPGALMLGVGIGLA